MIVYVQNLHIKSSHQIFLSNKSFLTFTTSMMCLMGARNTRGFSTALESNQLPPPTHITYEGIFNELKFDVGQKTKDPMDLHLGYARYQFADSHRDPSINDYLALFLKSERDGSERDSKPMNATILLDISGSMGGSLGERSQAK